MIIHKNNIYCLYITYIEIHSIVIHNIYNIYETENADMYLLIYFKFFITIDFAKTIHYILLYKY